MRNNSMKNEIVYYENAHNWHNQKYLKPKKSKSGNTNILFKDVEVKYQWINYKNFMGLLLREKKWERDTGFCW